jgi:hypothetical protein
MSTPKNLNQTKKKKGKIGGYESIPSMNHFKFMEIDDHVNFLYLNSFVALHNTIIVNITFCNHSCLHYNDYVGLFRAHIEFLHISSIPPSWKKTYMCTHHLHKRILKPIVGVWDFLSNSFPNLFIKV